MDAMCRCISDHHRYMVLIIKAQVCGVWCLVAGFLNSRYKNDSCLFTFTL